MAPSQKQKIDRKYQEQSYKGAEFWNIIETMLESIQTWLLWDG